MGSQLGGLIGGIWGDAGQNFVDLQGGPDKVFGKKPKIAPFVPTDLSAEIGKTTQANLDNADSITAMLDRLIPGFSGLVKQGLDTSGALLRGEIPQDVQDSIMRDDAFQSFMGGFSGQGMNRNLVARDFGKTSLDLFQMGSNSAQQWTKLAESSYDPFIVKTMQQAGTTAANNAGVQANKQIEYNVAAAPDPGAAGTFALDAALGQQMLSLGMAMGGAAMAGGGGAAGGGSSAASQAATYAAMAGGAHSPGNSYALMGGSGNSPAYQYSPSTGSYERVPVAVWGGG